MPVFIPTFFAMYENVLIIKLGLISKFKRSQPEKQANTLHTAWEARKYITRIFQLFNK